MIKFKKNYFVFLLFIPVLSFSQTPSQLLKEAFEHARKENHEKAISLYQEVLKKEPKNLVALQGLGLEFFSIQNHKEALHFLKEAYSIDPKNITTLFSLARVYGSQKQYPQAHYYYKRILTQDPYHLEAYLGKARLYSDNKQYHLATQMYEKILELDPYHKSALEEVSHIYVSLEKDEEALHTAKRYLELHPKDLETFINLGSIYEKQDNINAAIHWYEKAKKLDPENERILAKLSLLYGKINQIDDSLTNLQAATELGEANLKNYTTLGRAYGWLYRVEDAIVIFEKAYQLNPNDIRTITELASLYLQNGQWDKAENLYKKVLSLEPKNTEGIKGLERVNVRKKPVFTSRFNYKTLTNKRLTSSNTTNKKFELSDEVEFKLTPSHKFMLLYQRNHHYQKDTGGDRDYDFFQDIGAFKYNFNFWKDFLFSGRADYNHFSNHKDNQYDFKEENMHIFSTYSFLRYSQKKYYTFLSFRRGLTLRLLSRPNRLLEEPYYDYGSTVGIDIFPNVETILYYAYTNYKHLKDQHNIEGSISYQLPFLDQIEFGYSFEWLSDPIERLHTGSFRFKDRFFKKLLFDFLYKFGSNNNDNDQGTTYKQSLKTQLSFPLYKEFTFNFEGKWEKEHEKDHDLNQEYRTYLTLPLGMF